MSYDDTDARRDAAYDDMYEDMYDAISNEIRDDTIEQFSSDRLKSYYVQNPTERDWQRQTKYARALSMLA